MAHAFARTLLPLAAALSLAACGQDDSDATYETNVEDQSGGELIVSTPDPNAIPVTLPETPMTNVPAETGAPPATATTSVATPTPVTSPTP